MAGDRPSYSTSPPASSPAGSPDDVLATGGIAGDGDARRCWSSTGREQHVGPTCRPARLGRADAASERRAAIPRASPSCRGAHPALFRSEHPRDRRLLRGRVVQGPRHRGRTRATTRSSSPSATRPRRWDRPRASSRRSTRWPCSPRPTAATIEDTGTTVWRPPYAPITLGALAGRGCEPVRYSPMQQWHEAHGARPLVAGAWIRPDHYGDPAAEVRNVRRTSASSTSLRSASSTCAGRTCRSCSTCCTSTSGASSGSAGVRYGVMCAEDGVVLDDGVTGRLGTRALPDVDHLVRCGHGLGVGRELVADGASRVGRPRHARDDRLRQR